MRRMSFPSLVRTLAALSSGACVIAAGLVQAPHSLAQETTDAGAVQADIELRDENYAAWRDHILPNPSEMAWEQIPWLTTFKDGIVAAAAADKPLLLWTMNGHPLGCT